MSRVQWSVMVPTYHCAQFLEAALRSILVQDPGPDVMEIEVVDDGSTLDDPGEVVRRVGGGRVKFYRQGHNVGIARNFNTCLERADGEWVHILHGDDLVLPGFYQRLNQLTAEFPEVGIFFCRSLFVDEEGIPVQLGRRVPALEQPTHDASPFYYENPIQTPGVVMRRCKACEIGGFNTRYSHLADMEMWARMTHEHGALMTPEVLAHYRRFEGNDTSLKSKSGATLRERLLLADEWGGKFADFVPATARFHIRHEALQLGMYFLNMGDREAARANLEIWRHLATPRERVRVEAQLLVKAFRRAGRGLGEKLRLLFEAA